MLEELRIWTLLCNYFELNITEIRNSLGLLDVEAQSVQLVVIAQMVNIQTEKEEGKRG